MLTGFSGSVTRETECSGCFTTTCTSVRSGVRTTSQFHHLGAHAQGGGEAVVLVGEPQLGNALHSEFPPLSALVLLSVGRRQHAGRWVGYLYGTPPVPGLEPGISGLAFGGPLVERTGGAVESAQHAPAHPDRQSVPLREVSAHVGEHPHAVVQRLVQFSGELLRFGIVMFRPPLVGAFPRLEAGVVQLRAQTEYLREAAVLGGRALGSQAESLAPLGHLHLKILDGCDKSEWIVTDMRTQVYKSLYYPFGKDLCDPGR